MKIVIIQGAFLPIPPTLGGAVEKMWHKLGKIFASHEHQVTHICRSFEQMPQIEKTNGVTYVRIKGYNTPKSILLLKIQDFFYSIRAIRKIPSDTDIVISNTFWVPILLWRNKSFKIYVDIQRQPKGQMWLYSHVSRFRTNSSSVSKRVKKELPLQTHSKVIMIPNPIPFVGYDNLTVPEKKNIILYVGRIHPEKGLELLLEAYKQTDQSFTLMIIGPHETSSGGGGKTYLMKLQNLAKGQNIQFLGPIFDESTLINYYSEASIFVYPSVAENGETFGIAPLEAMSWGCVPVVSNLECFQDFINPKNGLIFDHRSSNASMKLALHIQKLQNNTSLRSQLAKESIRVRQTHSSNTIAELFLNDFMS